MDVYGWQYQSILYLAMIWIVKVTQYKAFGSTVAGGIAFVEELTLDMPFNLNFNSIFLALPRPGKPTKRAKEDSGLQEVVEKGTDCRTDQE